MLLSLNYRDESARSLQNRSITGISFRVPGISCYTRAEKNAAKEEQGRKKRAKDAAMCKRCGKDETEGMKGNRADKERERERER